MPPSLHSGWRRPDGQCARTTPDRLSVRPPTRPTVRPPDRL